MEIVDIDHSVQVRQVSSDSLSVDALRGVLQQHVETVAHQNGGSGDDEERNHDRDHRVDGSPAGVCDSDSGDNDGDRTSGVDKHMEICAADVDAFLCSAGEQKRRNHIGEQADDCDDEHRRGLNLRLLH